MTAAAAADVADVADAAAAHDVGPEYVATLGKVVLSHVRNELAGAVAFDEPAIALAPTARDKWLACRIAMEEYGHHLRFQRLANELDVKPPAGARSLSVFDFALKTWLQFTVLKAIVDMAEVVLMEELAGASYVPLRELAERLLPEERFHVGFGRDRARRLAADAANRDALQRAVDDLVGATIPFFGRSESANNEAFRRWGIKRRTNDEARADWAARCREIVEGDLGLGFPEVDLHWTG